MSKPRITISGRSPVTPTAPPISPSISPQIPVVSPPTPIVSTVVPPSPKPATISPAEIQPSPALQTPATVTSPVVPFSPSPKLAKVSPKITIRRRPQAPRLEPIIFKPPEPKLPPTPKIIPIVKPLEPPVQVKKELVLLDDLELPNLPDFGGHEFQNLVTDPKTNELYHIFENSDFTVDPNGGKLTYQAKYKYKKMIFKWGQRKLGLALLQFLLFHVKTHPEIKNPTIIYAGAAPGTNIILMTKLFKNVKWILYDPRKFDERFDQPDILNNEERSRIIIKTGEEGWFTNETAADWGNQQKENQNIFFISDIRRAVTISRTKEELEANEAIIWEDMTMQQHWHLLINPIESQLKFRLPFLISEDPKNNRIYNYLSGILYKGIWRGIKSTESRLVPIKDSEGNWKFTNWDLREYESLMFFDNVKVRGRYIYINPLYKSSDLEAFTPVYPPNLFNDWDSTAETMLWKKYLTMFGSKITVNSIEFLSNKLTSYLGTRKIGKLAELKTLADFWNELVYAEY